MNHERGGIAIIINNGEFSNGESRKGFQADVQTLSLALTELDFKLVLHKNCSAQEMIDLLADYIKRDFSDEDCFLCAVIMSHGDRGVIMGADCKFCPKIELRNPNKENKSLANRNPKIFFIQACRGEHCMQNVRDYIEVDKVANGQETCVETLPDESDFFVQYSTVEGHLSFRHPENGSWFIQILASMRIQHGH